MSNKVFVGYDTREDIAYQVCEHSIWQHNKGTEVIPLKQKELRDKMLYWSCLLYTSPSPRDATLSRMPSSA